MSRRIEYRINDEVLSELTFGRPGILAYAKLNAPNSNGSLFIITYDEPSFQKDKDYTIFEGPLTLTRLQTTKMR